MKNLIEVNKKSVKAGLRISDAQTFYTKLLHIQNIGLYGTRPDSYKIAGCTEKHGKGLCQK